MSDVAALLTDAITAELAAGRREGTLELEHDGAPEPCVFTSPPDPITFAAHYVCSVTYDGHPPRTVHVYVWRVGYRHRSLRHARRAVDLAARDYATGRGGW